MKEDYGTIQTGLRVTFVIQVLTQIKMDSKTADSVITVIYKEENL